MLCLALLCPRTFSDSLSLITAQRLKLQVAHRIFPSFLRIVSTQQQLAATWAPVQGGSSQSDTESVASQNAVDLEVVELRVLADRRAGMEAELPNITCEETYLHKQHRRLLHGIFAEKHGESPTRWTTPHPGMPQRNHWDPVIAPARLPGCTHCASCFLSGSV